ncbi:DUF6507 family protein [Streptomyces sp. NPDC051578]|uniref:DUF6507 family protein n=1 Tax=Streptomyces sp. NPDC051578 TaxID=3365662 RepID=UPI00378A9163
MSTWDIKPDGVQGVLSKNAEAGGKFEEEFTAYGEGLVGAATWAGTMVLGGAGGAARGRAGPPLSPPSTCSPMRLPSSSRTGRSSP